MVKRKIYSIEFERSAVKALNKLPGDIQLRIVSAVNRLSVDPRHRGSKKLDREDNLYRIRAGDYRIIYQINKGELLVLVIRVGHRREIYR